MMTSAETIPSEDTVVVGVDGSEEGRRALRYAVMLALRDGQALRLIHVSQPALVYTPMVPYLPDDDYRAVGMQILAEAETQACDWGMDVSRVMRVLVQGTRTAGFMHNLEDASCVVLGTRSSRLEHFFSGSTTVGVIAHSSVPVHCVPEAWDPEASSVDQVLVGVDVSEVTGQVLACAFAEAAAREVDLEIVHAWRPPTLYDTATGAGTAEAPWVETARTVLEGVIEEVAAAHPQVHWNLTLHFEDAVVTLHTLARHADVLVVGRRGRHVMFGLRVGSTARTLLRSATCPLVVVPVEEPA